MTDNSDALSLSPSHKRKYSGEEKSEMVPDPFLKMIEHHRDSTALLIEKLEVSSARTGMNIRRDADLLRSSGLSSLLLEAFQIKLDNSMSLFAQLIQVVRSHSDEMEILISKVAASVVQVFSDYETYEENNLSSACLIVKYIILDDEKMTHEMTKFRLESEYIN